MRVLLVLSDMRITVLAENTAREGFAAEHGLSLHIRLSDGRRILFDMGQSDLFVQNARRLGIDLSLVDAAVLSHGHYDHGGGLSHFLALNGHAPVYAHREAFLPHYSLRDTGMHFIGLDASLEYHPQVRLCEGLVSFSSGGKIFSLGREKTDAPRGNRWLYGPDKKKYDTFSHEQNLLIEEGVHTVLFAGCAHKGIVSIMQEATRLAGHPPTHVFAGMHLVKSGLSRQEEERYIHDLAQSLRAFPHCHYYTMHCTGVEQFEKLRTHMPGRISYLGTGKTVEVD